MTWAGLAARWGRTGLDGLAAKALLLSTCAALSGCAATAQDRLDALRRSVEGYNEAYRWKNYERAAAFLPADLRAAFLASYEEDDKSLHVEGYQILSVSFESPDRADVKVRYRYMALPSVVLEQRVVTQHWARVNEQWILEHERDPIRPVEPGAAGLEGYGGPEGPPPAPTMEVEIIDSEGTILQTRRGSPVIDDSPEP